MLLPDGVAWLRQPAGRCKSHHLGVGQGRCCPYHDGQADPELAAEAGGLAEAAAPSKTTPRLLNGCNGEEEERESHFLFLFF